MLPIIVALLFVLAPADPEPVEIPLGQVWGHNVEGTKPIALSVDPEKGLILLDQLERLQRSMGTVHAGPAFVVNGEPKQAIKLAMAVLDGQIQPKHSFTEGNLCLVVCAYAITGRQFHLDKVEQGGHRIKVSWHLDPNQGQEMAYWHLVLIPLPKCKPGDYDVEINRTGEPKFGPDWWVSKSTSFQVLKIEEPAPQSTRFCTKLFSERHTVKRSIIPVLFLASTLHGSQVSNRPDGINSTTTRLTSQDPDKSL